MADTQQPQRILARSQQAADTGSAAEAARGILGR